MPRKRMLTVRKRRFRRPKAPPRLTVGKIPSVGDEHSVGRLSTNSEPAANTLVVDSLSATTSPSSPTENDSSCSTVDITYRCEICHLIFTSEYNLRQHLDYYGDPRFQCEDCGTKFTDKRQLQCHVLNAHGTANSKFAVKCIICMQMFARSEHLRAHLCHYHENWKESVEEDDNLVNCLSEFDTAETEHLHLIRNGTNCREHLERRMKTQRLTRSETQLQHPQTLTSDAPDRCKNNEDKRDKCTRMNGNMAPGMTHAGLPRVRVTRLGLNQLSDVRLKSPEKPRLVAIKDHARQDRGPKSNEGKKSHEIASSDSELNESDIEAPSLDGPFSDAPSIDFQDKLRTKNEEDSVEKVRSYAEEVKQRILFGCKDCYVPLLRLENLEKADENGKNNSSQPIIKESHTLIPSIICDKSFESEATMLQHYRQHHFKYSNDKVFCICGKEIQRPETLQCHLYRYCRQTFVASAPPSNSSDACKPLAKKFACAGCGEKFWLESCLSSHVADCQSFADQRVQKKLTMREKKRYVCKVCRIRFNTEKGLLHHEGKYSGVAHLRCNFCETMFPSDYQLIRHMNVTHMFNTTPDFIYVCKICSQPFKDKRLERIHRMHIHRSPAQRQDDPESPSNHDYAKSNENSATFIYMCNVCNLVFSSERQLIEHTIYYAKNEVIHCKSCDKTFDGQYMAHHHNKEIHYSADTWMAFTHWCNVCREGFMFIIHLRAHMFHVHVNELDSNTFVDQQGSTKLGAKHNNKKLEYSWLRQLRDLDTVTVPDAHSCDVCDVRFPSRSSLTEHKNEFANDNGYLCERCSKKCSSRAALIEHYSLTHCNDRINCDVKCVRCKQTFLSETAWVSHAKHCHREAEPSEFYFEENVVFARQSDGYELIPTNPSISSGLAHSKIKISFGLPKSSAETVRNGEEHGKRSLTDVRRNDNVMLENDKLVTNDDGTRHRMDFNNDSDLAKLDKPVTDMEIINHCLDIARNESNAVTTTVSMPVLREDQSSLDMEGQSVDTSLDNAVSQIKMDDAKKEKATIMLKTIRLVSEGIQNKSWHCSICNGVFHDRDSLAKHVAMYSDRGHYMCEFCGRRFGVPTLYSEHKCNHRYADNVEFSCALCHEGFDTYTDMRMHTAHIHPGSLEILPTISDTNDSAYKDGSLGHEDSQVAENKARQQRHQIPYSSRPVSPSLVGVSQPVLRTYSRKCNALPKTVATQGADLEPDTASVPPSLDTEILNNSIAIQFECPDCRKHFFTITQLYEHRRTVHCTSDNGNNLEKDLNSTAISATCHVCDKVFANEKFLDMHKERRHSMESEKSLGNLPPKMKKVLPNSKPKILAYREQSIAFRKASDNYRAKKKFDSHPRRLRPLLPAPVRNGEHITVQLKEASVNDVPLPLLAAKNVQPVMGTPNVAQTKIQTLNNRLRVNSKPEMRMQIPSEVEQQESSRAKSKPDGTKDALTRTASGPNMIPLRPMSASTVHGRTHFTVQVKASSVNHEPRILRAARNVQTVPEEPSVAQSKIQTSHSEVGQRESSTSESNPGSAKNTLTQTGSATIATHSILKKGRLPMVRSHAVSIGPTEIVEVQPEAALGCQYTCSVCNVIFVDKNELTRHELSVHTTGSAKHSGRHTTTEAAYAKNPINEIYQLVGGLPSQSDNVNHLESPLDFESVLIPVSTDDLERFEDENSNNTDVDELINPLDDSVGNTLPPNKCPTTKLKVRPFADIVENLTLEYVRKRNHKQPTNVIAIKRPKAVFDPEMYERLCREHGVILNTDSCETE